MKKIFAIALAVVMVLSMASAFALSACATWAPSWPCTPDDVWCGQGKVEVVPYVKVNTACGWEFQVSDCASAIKSEEVFFAVKLTVDAYPDLTWWDQAIVDLETEGLDMNGEGLDWDYFAEDGSGDVTERYVFDPVVDVVNGGDFGGIDFDAKTEKVYYLSNNSVDVAVNKNTWVAAADAEFANGSNVVFDGVVLHSDVCHESDYSVCAKLTSYYDGWSIPLFNTVGDYVYGFNSTVDGEYTGIFWVGNEDDNTEGVNFNVVDGVVLGDTRSSNEFYNKVLADFGLANCGTVACITEDNIQANFGWDDEQEDCFDWSTKGASVVDTDCVVAIPKTGDASVLAWLF